MRVGSISSTLAAGVTVDDIVLDSGALPPASNEPSTRSISSSYDGLLRLTSAQESGATSNSYSYSYDKAGNRLDGGRSYDAANQVVGWSYDAAGNLLSDGTTAYTYDALNRAITTGGTTNSYNADSVLVQQGTTRYVQDLAAPLSQILSDGTSTYVYGQERLFAQASGGAKLWYATDALGSVRQTLNDSGAVLGNTAYDPWGQVQQGSVPTFGFTGELQQGNDVYLRARWYNSQRGTFTAKDPFMGFPSQPYSFHSYQYGYSNPVLNRDPSGRCMPLLALVDGPLPFGDAAALATCLVTLGYLVTQQQADAAHYYSSLPYQRGAIPLYPGPPTTAQSTGSVIGAPQPAPTPAPAPYVPPMTPPAPVPTPAPVPPQPAPGPVTTAPPQTGVQPIATPTVDAQCDVQTDVQTQNNRRQTRKHISLGMNWNRNNELLLLPFTINLNLKLQPQGISVYAYSEWQAQGLSSVPASLTFFAQAFHEAVQKAEHIHFNLEGISGDPVDFAEKHGAGRPFESFVTAYELYYIRHNPAVCLSKTSFYTHGSTDVFVPSAEMSRRICSVTGK